MSNDREKIEQWEKMMAALEQGGASPTTASHTASTCVALKIVINQSINQTPSIVATLLLDTTTRTQHYTHSNAHIRVSEL